MFKVRYVYLKRERPAEKEQKKLNYNNNNNNSRSRNNKQQQKRRIATVDLLSEWDFHESNVLGREKSDSTPMPFMRILLLLLFSFYSYLVPALHFLHHELRLQLPVIIYLHFGACKSRGFCLQNGSSLILSLL